MTKILDEMVVVGWIDSAGHEADWTSSEKLMKEIYPSEIITIGRCIREDKDSILLAFSVSDDHICGYIAIPRFAVKRIEILEIKKRRTRK